MAETVSGLVSALTSEASFDITSGQALVWLNRSWRTMLGRARAYQDTVSFGSTVVDQAFYTSPAGVKELYSLEVAGVPFGRARRPDGYANTQGRLTWTDMGEAGLFYPDANASSVRGVALIPTPSEAGLAITGFAATSPPDLTDDGAGNTLLNAWIDDHYEGLIAGAMAIGYGREGNSALKVAQDAIFDSETAELRRDTKRRFRGPGPTQIRVEVR